MGRFFDGLSNSAQIEAVEAMAHRAWREYRDHPGTPTPASVLGGLSGIIPPGERYEGELQRFVPASPKLDHAAFMEKTREALADPKNIEKTVADHLQIKAQEQDKRRQDEKERVLRRLVNSDRGKIPPL